MLGTIKEYAGLRLAEAGESDLARRAHLAYFTELTETADPHLRRAMTFAIRQVETYQRRLLPRSFGGNMDYNQIREGVTVYFPVYHPGALLFVDGGMTAL